jgi:hypothetical protein
MEIIKSIRRGYKKRYIIMLRFFNNSEKIIKFKLCRDFSSIFLKEKFKMWRSLVPDLSDLVSSLTSLSNNSETLE